MSSTFRARWLASWEVISQVLFTSEQLKENKMVIVGVLSEIKLLFWPPVIQLVWYMLKQLYTSVLVKVVDINLAAECGSVNIHHYSPPLRWIIILLIINTKLMWPIAGDEVTVTEKKLTMFLCFSDIVIKGWRKRSKMRTSRSISAWNPWSTKGWTVG